MEAPHVPTQFLHRTSATDAPPDHVALEIQGATVREQKGKERNKKNCEMKTQTWNRCDQSTNAEIDETWKLSDEIIA